MVRNGVAGRRSDIVLTGHGRLSQGRVCAAVQRSFTTGYTVSADEYFVSPHSSHDFRQHGGNLSAEKYFGLAARHPGADGGYDGDKGRIERISAASFRNAFFSLAVFL